MPPRKLTVIATKKVRQPSARTATLHSHRSRIADRHFTGGFQNAGVRTYSVRFDFGQMALVDLKPSSVDWQVRQPWPNAYFTLPERIQAELNVSNIDIDTDGMAITIVAMFNAFIESHLQSLCTLSTLWQAVIIACIMENDLPGCKLYWADERTIERMLYEAADSFFSAPLPSLATTFARLLRK